MVDILVYLGQVVYYDQKFNNTVSFCNVTKMVIDFKIINHMDIYYIHPSNYIFIHRFTILFITFMKINNYFHLIIIMINYTDYLLLEIIRDFCD